MNTPPNADCDACHARAGTWCNPGCSESPPPRRPVRRMKPADVIEGTNLRMRLRDPRIQGFATNPDDAPFVHALVEEICEQFNNILAAMERP